MIGSDSYLRAISESDRIENSLLYQEHSYENNDPELRLLGFCLFKLGVRKQNIRSVATGGIENLLNENNVHHRRIELPKSRYKVEYPMLIVFDEDSNIPLALYRLGRNNWLYNPYTQDHIIADNTSKLADFAYEVYASLPARIVRPHEVFKFAFTNEASAIIALLLTSLIVMVFNLSIPVLTNILVSRILPHNDRQLLLEGLAILLLIVTGSVSAQYLQNRMMLRIESVADLRLQTAVWDRILRLPMNFINRFTTGDLSSRANAINQLGQQLGSGVLTTVLASIFAMSYFVLMYIYDARLALWASAFSALGLVCTFILAARMIEVQIPLQEKGAEIINFSLQTIMGIPQIRSAGAEPFVLLEWLKKISAYATLGMKNNFYSDAIEQYAVLISPMSSLLIFASITSRLLSASDDAETTAIVVSYVSFNAAFTSFNGALTNAMNILASTLGQAFVLWKRAEPVICIETEPGYLPEAIEHNLVGNFEFRNINYIHENSNESIFSNLNLSIRSGEHTVITGPSGSGKTTLLRMLLGFIYPETGNIIVDGIPLKDIAIRSYRRQMGVVMQNARLNGGTVFDLVCCGGLYTEDDVWRALECAALAEDIKCMPMQLETLVNDSGSTLSGGQIQRLAIARALITKPKVLLMDEATSALDNFSQQKIAETIRGLGITRISVAHRVATMKGADQIIIIQNKNTVESGSWQEMRASKYFQQLVTPTQVN